MLLSEQEQRNEDLLKAQTALQETLKEKDRQVKDLMAKAQKQHEEMQVTNETVAKRDKQVRSLLQKVKSLEQDLLKYTETIRRNERTVPELRPKLTPTRDTPGTATSQLKLELAQANQKLVAKEHEMELLREMMASWQSKYRAQEMDRIRKGFRETPVAKRLKAINHSTRTSQASEEDAERWLKKSKEPLEQD